MSDGGFLTSVSCPDFMGLPLAGVGMDVAADRLVVAMRGAGRVLVFR